MKLTFLGTKAYIPRSNDTHKRHSSLLIEEEDFRLMIDCGEDWRGSLDEIKPDALVLTHAHPDHAFGLADGAPCPVWATKASWEKDELKTFPIADKKILPLKEPVTFGEITLTAFPVQHAKTAPAVALRIGDGAKDFVYVPDVVVIEERDQVLDGIDLYIGDGTSLTTPLVRRQGSELFGHTTIRAQLGWCAKAKVDRVFFTHCGSEIIKRGDRSAETTLHQMAKEKGLPHAKLAHDGLAISL